MKMHCLDLDLVEDQYLVASRISFLRLVQNKAFGGLDHFISFASVKLELFGSSFSSEAFKTAFTSKVKMHCLDLVEYQYLVASRTLLFLR